MIPFILASIGGYFLGNSMSKKFADGGISESPTNRDVMEEGDILDYWDDNGNLDNIVTYHGLEYLVTTDQEGNPINPEKRATHWYDESLMEYKDGGKTNYRENRPSPSESATIFAVGTKQRGNDGYMWEIKANVKGTHRWVKIPGTLDQKETKEQKKNTGFGRYAVRYIVKNTNGDDDASVWVYANDADEAINEVKREYWDVEDVISVQRINDGW